VTLDAVGKECIEYQQLHPRFGEIVRRKERGTLVSSTGILNNPPDQIVSMAFPGLNKY